MKHWLLLSLLCGSVVPALAQVVNDGATVTLSNVTNTITGTVTVGTNGSFTLLTLADNALLNNSLHDIIGLNATARSNEVRLASPTARWLMGGDLAVGSSGSFSRFVVSNGARAENNLGSLAPNGQSSNNLALVTGSGSLWSNRSDVIVGWFGRNNELLVSDGGRVVNVAGGTIGSQASAPGNVATVTGSGSIWNAGSALTVGYLGANNRLVVEAGGRVDCGTGRVGYGGGSNNLALVTGAGSLWSNVSLEIGGFGPNNQLIVSNGATVVSSVDNFIGHDPGASNNVALVTGVGSGWSSDGLYVGYQEGRNQLVVSNGAVVANRVGLLGYFSIANNNTAVVTGSGSVWSNRLALLVGLDGAGNRLNVSDGGLVAANNVNVGVNSSSLNNRVVVSGGTLRASDGAGTGTLDVRRGTNVLLAGLVETDRLLLTNTAGKFELLGGTLVTRGALGNNGSGMVVGPAGASPAVWDVRPGAFDHAITLGVVVGNSSPGHQLLVSGGALLTNGVGGFVGLGAGANANDVSIAGANSRWRVGGDVFVGAGGAGNQLTVSDGGWVGAASGRLGASSAGSSDNVALVTGSGSVWSNAASMIVGEIAPGNQLQIRNGGAVVAAVTGVIGQNAGANANTALIADAGSRWLVASDLSVGSSGSGNQLTIQNGGLVDNLSGRVGDNAGSINNLALVSGSGSLWSNRANVIVGFSGAGNQLLVNNGGRVVAGAGSTIGSQVSAPGNLATVTGNGSVWSSGGGLTVGNLAANNRLLIEAGGRVDCTRGILGFGTGSNNVAVVTGAGSAWSNSVELQVGGFGANNQLIVSNGAVVVTDVDGYLGHDPGASNNVAVVTGAGSLWTSDGLVVGYQDGRNQLAVSNGGVVADRVGYLGFTTIANNNVAVVTGAGSVWSNRLNLFVGVDGAGNRLDVSNGATVLSSNLFVGLNSVNNRIEVTGGGRLVTARGSIGFTDTANGNAVVVRDTGSIWTNLASLIVGESGSGNALIAGNGATVASSNLIVGLNSASTNNRVTVNGGTLRVTSAAGTGVLEVRRGTNILNAGLVDVDKLVLTNRGQIPVFTAFENNNLINFTGTIGISNYLSTITVAGYKGSATKVSVTLSNLSLSSPRDYDILLVSPAGQKVMLISDAGGTSGGAGQWKLTFDDDAPAVLPNSTMITNGNYRPTDYQPGETLPSPAPAGPYSTNLSSFNGSNPNGVWSLYVANDASSCCGSLFGWGLRIETDEGPFTDPGMFEFNGGTLVTRGAVIGNGLPFVVGGPGGVPAVWDVRAGASEHALAGGLIMGEDSSFNQMLIPGSAIVSSGGNVIVGGLPAASSNNLLHVTGGTLRVLTPGAALDVRGGTNRLDAGLVDLLHLVVTNTCGQFEFNGGTLRTPDTRIDNGRVFTVGGGASVATLQLLGGTHTFANNLTVAINGSLIGTGVIDGTITVSPGGRLTPGSPIGNMDVLGSVILQGTVNLQIDKSGGVRTSDELSASGAIFYNGTLNVTDIGTDVLAAGDRFFLFDATPYVGAFTTLNLPPLASGLSWRNNLSLDGAIEVIAAGGQPGIASIIRSGTNVVFAGTNGTPGANYTVLATTNVALPASNWTSIATRQFDASGGFTFTNAIAPAIPQRFYQLRVP